jgi:hypothetical protein
MENSSSNSTFLAHFLTFVSQAITGVLFPFYKDITDNGTYQTYTKKYCIEQFHDLNVVPILYIDYINECWDKYNKKDDPNKDNDEYEYEYDYVIVKLDKIKKAGNIIHNYCLFDLLWNFSFKILVIVLARIDESILGDFDTFKISVNKILDITLDNCKDELNYYEENCNDSFIQKKIMNYEDKFINVKYVMGVC